MKPTMMRAAIAGSLLAWGSAQAQVSNSSSVVDGGGGWCSNTTYRSVTAFAQPCPVGANESAANLNYSGFLNTFILHPDLDTDADGIVDENDPDNDNDGLRDLTELEGIAFNPATATDTQVADSDGDGATDGEEAGAMTNPLDAGSIFAVTAIRAGGNLELTWKARGGQQYQIEVRDEVAGGDWEPFGSPVTAVGGVAPWYATTASLSVSRPAESRQFYRARLVLP